MAVKLITVKCPECGATLDIEEGREQAFCTYCGAKVIIHNENEYVYRHIDDAQIKQAETDRIVLLKQMELAEKAQEQERKASVIRITVSIILAVVGTIMLILGMVLGDAAGNEDSGVYMISIAGMFLLIAIPYIWLMAKNKAASEWADFGYAIRVPSLGDYEKTHYKDIEAMFISKGFTNVRCVPLHDLKMGVLKKPGMVESVSINGNKLISGGKKYPKDAIVSISYHSMKY